MAEEWRLIKPSLILRFLMWRMGLLLPSGSIFIKIRENVCNVLGYPQPLSEWNLLHCSCALVYQTIFLSFFASKGELAANGWKSRHDKCHQLRWLVLCINLTGPWGARHLAKCYSTCVYKYFSMKINIWVDRPGGANCLPYCGWASSNRTKMLSKRELLLLKLDCQSFLGFRFELKHLLFLGCRPAGFQTEIYTSVSPDS